MASKKPTLEQQYARAVTTVPGITEPQRVRMLAHLAATNQHRAEPVTPAAARLATALLVAGQGALSVPSTVAEAESLLGIPGYGNTLAGLQDTFIELQGLEPEALGNRLRLATARRFFEHMAREAQLLANRLSN